MKTSVTKIIFLFMATLGLVAVQAQQSYFDVKLWENGLPNSNGNDSGEYILQGKNYKPVMRVFLPNEEKATGRAIVCYPGGGYVQTQLDHYADDWAPFYTEMGIAFIVLHYRVPNFIPEVTISDALEAYNQTKLHAKKWNINPQDIGIQGLSAGGHLASTVTTHFQDSIQAAFQILIYPVITFEEPYAHEGSKSRFIGNEPLLKENATIAEKEKYEKHKAKYMQLKELYSNEKHVTENTPRAFIAVSDNDK